MKKLIYFLLFLLIYSCGTNSQDNEKGQSAGDSTSVQNSINDSDYAYVEAFKGNFRCNDCPGVETEITFINDILTYKESRKFIGKNTTENLTGMYTTDRGYKEDDDATVYVLDYNKPGMERRFLKLDDNTIIILDKNDNVSDTTSYSKLFRTK